MWKSVYVWPASWALWPRRLQCNDGVSKLPVKEQEEYSITHIYHPVNILAHCSLCCALQLTCKDLGLLCVIPMLCGTIVRVLAHMDQIEQDFAELLETMGLPVLRAHTRVLDEF